MSDFVRLQLTKDEALVLFEWLAQRDEERARENTESDAPLDAEELVLTKIHGILEKSLVEPFDPNYGALLAAARRRVQEST